MTNYDWKKFLDFSSWIIDLSDSTKPDEETISRVAVSRAYYAAYHTAKAYLARIGVSDKTGTGSEHEKVCLAFKTMNKGDAIHKRSCQYIGNVLTTLKDERNKCDYKHNESMSIKKAKYSCGKASQIIQEISKL